MDKNNNHSKNLHKSNKGSRNLGQLIMQLQQLERHPRTFGEAGPLTPGEIHTIDAIGLGSGVLMSELADRLGVTKGAVTQIVTRNKMKEFVKRTSHPTDSRAVLVSLTEKGKDAYKAHEMLHQNFYKQLSSNLDHEEIEIFERCIEKLIEFLQK